MRCVVHSPTRSIRHHLRRTLQHFQEPILISLCQVNLLPMFEHEGPKRLHANKPARAPFCPSPCCQQTAPNPFGHFVRVHSKPQRRLPCRKLAPARFRSNALLFRKDAANRSPETPRIQSLPNGLRAQLDRFPQNCQFQLRPGTVSDTPGHAQLCGPPRHRITGPIQYVSHAFQRSVITVPPQFEVRRLDDPVGSLRGDVLPGTPAMSLPATGISLHDRLLPADQSAFRRSNSKLPIRCYSLACIEVFWKEKREIYFEGVLPDVM